jgi:membrane protein YdbS with pleckstrin-like domain
VAIRAPRGSEARRAYHRELRNVARLLRWTDIAMALVGAIGIALGGKGAWFVPPSWISFVLGWTLALCGVVRRERTTPAGEGK